MMQTNESWERFFEGLSRAASCCRELGKMTSVKDWGALSAELIKLRNNGKKIYDAKQLEEIQVQLLVGQIEEAQKAANYSRGGV